MSLSPNDKHSEPVSGKHQKHWKVYYFLTAAVGLCLAVFEVGIYRKTVIDFYIPMLVILGFGGFAFILNKTHYQRVHSANGFLYPLMQNIFSWGFVSGFLLLATNYYFASEEVTTHRVAIKDKSSLPVGRGHRKKRQPMISVDYFGFEKELIFKFLQTERVKQADSAVLQCSKGLLGFDVIHHYDVLIK